MEIRSVVKEKVERHVKAHHITDVKITHNGYGKRDDKQFIFSVLDELLNGIGQNRKPDQGVDPHGIVLLYDGIGAERIQHRKKHDK